jgi:hemoglobin
MTLTPFQRLGGEAKLRAVVDTFVDRVFADRMIGFFFRSADKARIKEMEYQLAASFLGAHVEYGGRPLDEVHRKFPIMGGHFARRKQILKESIEFHGIADDIRKLWLDHTDALRPLITPEGDSGCDPMAARERVKTA